MAVPVSFSDPVIITLFSLVTTALGLIIQWRATSNKREADLLERVNAQVVLILGEREKQVKDRDIHIDSLKDEIVKLREHVRALITVMQGVLKAGAECTRQQQGDCPVSHADLTEAVANVITKVPH